MRISFDLDDTLICYDPAVPREQRSFWKRWIFGHGEPLRLGTVALFRELRRRGCEVLVYTTSFRPQRSIRRWLSSYGLRVDDIINEHRHRQVLAERGIVHGPSKAPFLFGIDLHVDDLVGVGEEAVRFGFQAIIVAPHQADWDRMILREIDSRMIARRG